MIELWLARLGMLALTALFTACALGSREDGEAGCCFFVALVIGAVTFFFWNTP